MKTYPVTASPLLFSVSHQSLDSPDTKLDTHDHTPPPPSCHPFSQELAHQRRHLNTHRPLRSHVDYLSIDEWELTRLGRAQMSINLVYAYQLTNPKSFLTSTRSAIGRPIKAAPGFLRLTKDIHHSCSCSCSSETVRCVMSDTSLLQGAYKDGVVIVDHGSRRQQSNLLLNDFVTMFKNKTGYSIVEPAHMELADPSIRDAFGSCVQQGASRVIISPFFLFPGRHWNQDIPLLAEAAASEYPGVPYLVTAPLGLHELLVDVMKDRIDYCLSHVDGKVDECAVCAGTGKCKIKVQDSKT